MSAPTAIPLVDLRWQHEVVREEVNREMEAVMSSGAFIMGQPVRQFESEFAAFSGIAHCVGCASGTDALELALRAAGIGGDHEVLIPANTFMASVAAALRAGATPRLVDCDDDFLLIDPEDADTRVTTRTRAMMPVHLFGQIAPMDGLMSVANGHGLTVVEDAAQSQGATHEGRGPGSWGVAAGVSFYPGKNLGAYGDAGCVLTEDAGIASRLELLRNHGSPSKYEHATLGFTSRLDTLQAVVLRAKLVHLAEWNRLRAEAADRYSELLSDVSGVRLPAARAGNRHVWHLYVVRVPHRDEVMRRMQAEGIGVGVHYPLPVHLQPALRELGHRPGDFPVAERAAAEILSLPIYPGISVEQQERVVAALRRALP